MMGEGTTEKGEKFRREKGVSQLRTRKRYGVACIQLSDGHREEERAKGKQRGGSRHWEANNPPTFRERGGGGNAL